MTPEDALEIWNEWQTRLQARGPLRVDAATIAEVLSYKPSSEAAAKFANVDPKNRQQLQQLVISALPDIAHLSGGYLRGLLLGVVDQEYAIALLKCGESLGTVAQRSHAIDYVLVMLCERHGRQWMRNRAQRLWRTRAFLEEEQDAFVRALLKRQVYEVADFRIWGARAEAVARRVTRIASLEGSLSWSSDGDSLLAPVGGPRTSALLRVRGTLLTQVLQIAADVKDGGLMPAELDRLFPRRGPDFADFAYFAQFFSRMFDVPRSWIRERLRGHWPQMRITGAPDGQAGKHVAVPLLSVMHMRLLLESPSLADALQSPEVFLVPEVVQFMLGREYATYTPELRVLDEGERRWRARWVETTAEALALLVMEGALHLDLTTVARIPEQSDRPTPDFRAETRTNEPIVFESKGATAWRTHEKQRKRALEQLGKGRSSSDKRRGARTGVRRRGRSFALCLYAALSGSPQSSLFHVHDPPFIFSDLFGEQADDDARRSHFAAVLEAAQLFDEADHLLRRPSPDERRPTTDRTLFEIDHDEPGGDFRYVGSYLPVQQWARRLRLPDLREIDRLRVFTGVEQATYDALAAGKLPLR